MKTIAGRRYKTKRFKSVDSANEFMSVNPQWAVIHEEKRDTIYIDNQISVWVARVSDLGLKIN